MWLQTVIAVNAFMLFGVAFGQARPDQSDARRYSMPVWGRIIGYTGAPIQNQAVVLNGTDIKTKTDQDGKFAFENVEGDQAASLLLDVSGFSTAPVRIGVVNKLMGSNIGTVVLQPVRPIVLTQRPFPMNDSTHVLLSGRITDADGKAYGEKIVYFRDLSIVKPSQPVGVALDMVTTDPTGSFVFPASTHHEYQVFVPKSKTSEMYTAIGDVEVAGGRDVGLGNIAMQVAPPQEHVGSIVGPVKLSDSAPKTAQKNHSEISAIFVGAGEVINVILGDGNVVQQPKESGQVGISKPRISEDRTAAGWLVDSQVCCQSYPLSVMLVVYRPGKPPRHFRGDGRAIFGWTFVGGGRRVAFEQSFAHGELREHYELRDVETERLLGTWEPEEQPKRPAWANGVG
jgi:hypothetical protein